MKRGTLVGALVCLVLTVVGVGGCGDDDGGVDNNNVNQNSNNNGNSNSEGCGNGVREPDETCDGTDVGVETCEGLGFHGGLLGCNADCTLDESNCELVGWCGDGLVQSAWEVCDGTVMYPPACEDLGLGYDGGTVGCAVDCTWDESSCSICGNLVVEGPEACDEDNDDVRDGCHNCLATEFLVADATGLVPMAPKVAFAPDGGFVIVYGVGDLSAPTSYALRFDAQGLATGAPIQLSAPTPQDGVRDVVFDPTGRLLTVWLRQDGVPTIMAQYLDASLQPDATPFVVAENPGGSLYQGGQAVSINSAGELVVAFQARDGALSDGDFSGVFARRFTAQGTPVDDVFGVNTTTIGDQGVPSVALAADGRIIVAYNSGTNSPDANYALLQRFDAQGLADGAEMNLMPQEPSWAVTVPRVAMAPDGRAVVMWNSHPASSSSELATRALRFDSTHTVDGTDLLVSSAWGFGLSNSVAMAADGSFMLLWGVASPDLEISSVFARRYDALGVPSGAAFQVSAPGFYRDEMVAPNIGMAPNGNAAAVWGVLDLNDLPNSRYVYALRFDAQGRTYSFNPW